MKLKCVDSRRSLVRGKVVRQYSFVILIENGSSAEDPPAEVRLTDTSEKGINPQWDIGSVVEVT